MSKRIAWWKVAALGTTLVMGGALLARLSWSRFDGPINALGVNLAKPQAYIYTPGLSKLPRDLIKAPVLRDLLTEDLAAYYEQHEDRLGLRGAIRRIAYEHDLSVTDKLLEMALDEPAEVALWNDGKGAPRHWLIAMTRGTLAGAIQNLAQLAGKDGQLSLIGEVKINGAAVKAFALKLSSRRTLALVSQGNRIVVLSDPGLLFDDAREADSESQKVIASLLSGDGESQSVYRREFGLGKPGEGHTLLADGQLLSLGYQRFMPGVRALRMDLSPGGNNMDMHLRVSNAGVLPSPTAERALWQGLPLGAAGCTILPADWKLLQSTLGSAPNAPTAEAKSAWEKLSQHLDGPAAVCWYARSQWQTPLFVARTKPQSPDLSAALETLSAWAIPGGQASSAKAPTPKTGYWQKEIEAPWGQHQSGGDTRYRPTLAQLGQWISFSPDDELVNMALNAQARRYPSLADSLPEKSATLAIVAPKQLADLTQREVFQVLPNQLDLFRQAAENQLVPRLDALRKLPAARAHAPGSPDKQGWVTIEWEPLKIAGGKS